MKLAELFAELNGKTSLQKWTHTEGLIGGHVEIVAQIRDVYSMLVSLTAVAGLPEYADISVFFHGNEMTKQMLSFSRGDSVRLTALLRSASYGDEFEFDLISISKLSA